MRPPIIILAAGQGTRLRPLTDDRPKCLVEIHGKPLLEWQLDVARSEGVDDITVVRGYKQEAIDYPDVRYFSNPLFDTTNMVETLWCAEQAFREGFVVSYGDIIYQPNVLRALLDDPNPISVVVDEDWKSYWSARFSNVLDDAETLEMNDQGRILSIGQVPNSLDQIHAQYIGLMAFRGEGVASLRSVYEKAKAQGKKGQNPLRGQRAFENLYMTDILQGLIDDHFSVQSVKVNRGWLEIDSPTDLLLAQRMVQTQATSLTIDSRL